MEGGFTIPEAKSRSAVNLLIVLIPSLSCWCSITPLYVSTCIHSFRVAWKSKDVLLVGTDFKDGKSLTDSGYPRTVREWIRGTPLGESALVFEGEAADVSITGAIVSTFRQKGTSSPMPCILVAFQSALQSFVPAAFAEGCSSH